MKPSHMHTPRCLADCAFDVGYGGKPPRYTVGDLVLSYVLSFALGVCVALVAVV